MNTLKQQQYTLKKGKELITIYTHIVDYSIFAEDFHLLLNNETDALTISLDLNCNYRSRSKNANSYIDVQEVDSNLNAITKIEINNVQIRETFSEYLKHLSKWPSSIILRIIAKNQVEKVVTIENDKCLRINLCQTGMIKNLL